MTHAERKFQKLGCGWRVAILCGGHPFMCRQCLRLVYPSQRANHLDRILARKEKILRKLGWENGETFRKPKGMHWKTYKKLRNQYDAEDEAFIIALA